MTPPPFLLGAALLFWGWQTGFLLPAIAMALVIEGARWIETRWDLADEDFSRIWIFCTLLLLGAVIYAFTANEGPADFQGMFQNPNYLTQRNAGAASARTAAAVIRWLPMTFFPFIAAQLFSSRGGIPLQTISLILRWRWRQARRAGLPMPVPRTVDVSFAYFGLCLFGASAHNREDGRFFWGVCVLLAWMLWSQRSKRFSIAMWAASLGLAIGLGYSGQRGLGHLQRYLEGINAQLFSGLTRRNFDPGRSRTGLGQIGQIKTSGKILIRVETKDKAGPPPLLREASYRSYKAETWYSGDAKEEREPINALTTNKETWLLLPAKTNTSSAKIACYLERGRRSGGVHAGLLPLAGGSGRLEHLPAYLLNKNRAGAVIAQGPGLVMFDDFYGPGETIDSPPEADDYSQIPDREIAVIKKVAAELELAGKSREEKLNGLSRFFQSRFSYSTWQAQDHTWQAKDQARRTNDTPLARFLLRTRSGHCEYFATATVLLLRELKVPARYAVGYAVHESSGSRYVVRQRDAHAWCLVWNDDLRSWEDFDTTPASWVKAESQQASLLQFLSDAWSRFAFEIAKLRWGQSHIRQYLLWALVPALGALLLQIVLRGRHRRRGKNQSQLAGPNWPGLDSEFYEVEKRLLARGLSRQTGEPISGWLVRSSAQLSFREIQQPLEELLRLHYRYRFDPEGLSRPERQRLQQRAQECLAAISSRGS